MATSLNEWIPDIAPEVPMCPNQVIKKETLEICRDLCENTLLWDGNELAAINIVADTPEYALVSASGDIVSIDSVEIDGVPITGKTENELNNSGIAWRDETENPPQHYLLNQRSDNIRLVYTPSEAIAGGLVVWVNLKPLRTATTVEDFLWDHYRDLIAIGAKSRILGIRGMPWYDPKQAGSYEMEYTVKRNAALMKKFSGRVRGDLQVGGEFFC